MNSIVIDTSALIAAMLDEPDKPRLVALTQGVNLLAPESVHWELGNALSAMFKKGRFTLDEALAVVQIYERIPIQFVSVGMDKALHIAHTFGLYAYDAYVIACAVDHKAPLLTLDRVLKKQAKACRVSVLEI
jgi:predicted nucleic acid-binding protein